MSGSGILLIEDDTFKARRIAAFLKDNYPAVHLRVDRSVSSGLISVTRDPPELLILDMSLSTYDVGPQDHGGRPQNFGGITVLDHLVRRSIILPVVIITQFPGFKRDDGASVSLDAVRKELSEKFPTLFRALLFYSPGDRNWEDALVCYVKECVGGTL